MKKKSAKKPKNFLSQIKDKNKLFSFLFSDYNNYKKEVYNNLTFKRFRYGDKGKPDEFIYQVIGTPW